jgi:hypothetical protein
MRLGVGPSLYAGGGGGLGTALEFALGGTAAPGLVVGGMTSPKFLLVGGSEFATMSFLGPFVDYYPDPSNGLHFLGGVGVATTNVPDRWNSFAVSFEALAGLGKEWWVGSQWSIGLLGRLSYMNPGGLESHIFGNAELFGVNGLVSFTYH